MNFEEFFGKILFSIGENDVTFGQLTRLTVLLLITSVLYYLITKRWLKTYFEKEKFKTKDRSKVVRIIWYIFILIVFVEILKTLNIDREVYELNDFMIRISTILYAFLIFQFARLLDWITSKLLIHNYYQSRKEIDDLGTVEANYLKESEGKGGNIVKYTLYFGAVFLIFQSFNWDFTIFPNEKYKLQVSDIFEAILILLFARLLIWVLTQMVLYNYYKRSEVDTGAQYAINQLLKYIIYVLAFLIALSSLGVEITVLWGGAAALLVGLGLGLQQTFNDFFSGIILLFERSVSVGDVLDISGMVGVVKKIGLRASIVETRDNLSVIVPNSKLVTDNVVNWSQRDDKVRFKISVGVAYGSDTSLVKKILLEIADKCVYVNKHPAPFVRFSNFGDSSLDFELHFYSRNFIVIEDIKSDLRFEIDKAFRENKVEIPFPQRVVWNKKKDD